MLRPTRPGMISLVLAMLATACGEVGYIAAPKHEAWADLHPPPTTEAYLYLASKKGPVRFARVADTVYRGGQPSRKDLEMLKELGVRTIINLRREDVGIWRKEERNAKELGLDFLHFPFYGVFGAEDAFLNPIVAAMKKGNVYVHCKHGRDRTSLMVALYRVIVQGWDPKIAWKLEAIDYGSAQTFFYRELRVAFERMVKKLPLPVETPADAHPAKAAEKMPEPAVPPPGASPPPTNPAPPKTDGAPEHE